MSTPVPPRGGKGKGNRGGGGRKPPSGRQAAQAARNRRRRTWYAGGGVAVVIVAVVILVAVGLNSKTAAAAPRTLLTSAQESAVTSVPLDDLVAASSRAGSGLNGAAPLTAAALKDGSKPEILFIGAEFCPICATERWPMTIALSQFGTFSNLSQTRSAVTDGNIATLSYYKSSYSSPYFTFVPVETTTNKLAKGGKSYQTLETPTSAQQQLWTTTQTEFNISPGSVPFIDMGGKYALLTSQFADTELSGYNFDQILNDATKDPTSSVGSNIDAAAAAFTKYICDMDGDQPSKVCSAVAGVQAPISSSSSTGSTSQTGG